MLRFYRKQQNSVKQLSFNKKISKFNQKKSVEMWACMGPGLWVPANLISESEHIPADIWVKEETVNKG